MPDLGSLGILVSDWPIYKKTIFLFAKHYWNKSVNLQMECNYQLDENLGCHISIWKEKSIVLLGH